jgi:Uma2 family endonuclease
MVTSQDPLVVKGEILSRMWEEEFFHFCQENRDLRIERNSKLEIIVMSPTGSETGRIEMEVGRQLSNWNHTHQLGKVFGSSTGFRLPDQSVLSPDAAWVAAERWSALSPAERKGFAPLTPDFVVEVRSSTDSEHWLREKMLTYLRNGCRLAWLIDPEQERVATFHADGRVEEFAGFDRMLQAGPVLPGFELDLALLR